jgi:hypothetical protein
MAAPFVAPLRHAERAYYTWRILHTDFGAPLQNARGARGLMNFEICSSNRSGIVRLLIDWQLRTWSEREF